MTSDLPNLQDIKARYEAMERTDTEWFVEYESAYREWQVWRRFQFFGEQIELVARELPDEKTAEFIAHSLSAVPALVAALEAVIEECERHPETGTGNILNLITQHLTIGDKQ